MILLTSIGGHSMCQQCMWGNKTTEGGGGHKEAVLLYGHFFKRSYSYECFSTPGASLEFHPHPMWLLCLLQPLGKLLASMPSRRIGQHLADSSGSHQSPAASPTSAANRGGGGGIPPNAASPLFAVAVLEATSFDDCQEDRPGDGQSS